MEIELIESSTTDLRQIVPDINISAVKSFVGENFWSFELANSQARGSGAALDATLAFQKAISEFIERDAFRLHAKLLNTTSSSGFASHTTLKAAHNAAISEVLERDVLLLCWFSDIPPCWIPRSSLSFSRQIIERLDYLESIGIEVRIGLLGKSCDDFVSAGMLNFESFTSHKASWAFTTEAEPNLRNAIEKTALSLLRIANLILTRRSRNAPLFSEIGPSEISKPNHHLEYHLNPKNREFLLDWWNSTNTEVADVGAGSIECFEIETDISRQMQRFISFANSESLIPYFAGFPRCIDRIRRRLADLGLKQRRSFEVIHPLP